FVCAARTDHPAYGPDRGARSAVYGRADERLTAVQVCAQIHILRENRRVAVTSPARNDAAVIGLGRGLTVVLRAEPPFLVHELKRQGLRPGSSAALGNPRNFLQQRRGPVPHRGDEPGLCEKRLDEGVGMDAKALGRASPPGGPRGVESPPPPPAGRASWRAGGAEKTKKGKKSPGPGMEDPPPIKRLKIPAPAAGPPSGQSPP